MSSRKAFVVFLLLLASLNSCQGDDGSDFIATKQQEVQTIAEAAVLNYQNTCELVSTCLSDQNCSRLECYPSVNQTSETTCTYVDNNELCTNSIGSACDLTQANFERGYVRTAPLNFAFNSLGGVATPDLRELYFGNTVCTQRNLDPTFINVSNTIRTNSSLNYFYNFYFGSVDGSFRYYPGRGMRTESKLNWFVQELLNNQCGSYDPRIRPWYTGAISILKDLVILVDTGWSMQNNYFFEPPTPYLEITKSVIRLLVETLTGGDRVTIVSVNASGSYTGQPNSQYFVLANQPLHLNDEGFQGLLAFINSSTFAEQGSSNQSPSNFTAGFHEADSIFNQALRPTNSTKIVILLTNSEDNNDPDEDAHSAANDLKNSAQLFVYDISNTSGWESLACVDREATVYVGINPLLWLNSYFSFLARARIAVNGGPTPFWQTPYEDATGLGQVITVAYPAMSPDGPQLIGVAAIDIQLAGLDSDPFLNLEILTVLDSSPYAGISVNPLASSISICDTAYQNSCPDVPAKSTKALCYPSQNPANDDQLKALLCCDCAKRSHNYIAIWICLGVLGPVAVVLVLLIILWKRAQRRPEGKGELAFRIYSYPVLRKATNDFASKNVIGRGSSGVVYRAVVGDKTVAVKQLYRAADQVENFEGEINMLGITSHPNLVELIGTCFRPTECFLVYELIDGLDLHTWLWPEERNGTQYSSVGPESFLTWNARRVIALGVARALNFLHQGLESNRRACHLAIRPHNILLDFNGIPKITDFGVSLLYEPDLTSGYTAPELSQDQMVPNSKLDVYSYGMVLLQLVSGRKIDDPEVSPSLLQWARKHRDDGHVEKVVNRRLIATVQEQHSELLMANCKQMISLALLCLSERPEHRPDMSDVLDRIDSLENVDEVESSPVSERGGSDWTVSHSNSSSSDHPHAPNLDSESIHDVGSSQRISTMTGVGSFLENNSDEDNEDDPGILGRSDGDTLFVGSLEMVQVASEPKPSTLRRSLSS